MTKKDLEFIRDNHELDKKFYDDHAYCSYNYELGYVDAYEDEESCWCWNESIRLSDFTVVSTTNIPRKFVRELHKLGVYFVPNRILVYDDGDLLEIVDRKTKQPLFAALML